MFLRAKGHILMENKSFGGFSADLHRKNHPAALGRIPVSGGFAAIFAGVEPARLRYLVLFAGKSPSYASHKSYLPTSVHHRGMGLASGSVHP